MQAVEVEMKQESYGELEEIIKGKERKREKER